MPPPELSQHHVGLIADLAARLLDSRKTGTNTGALARDLLGGFHDICMRWGLDKLLAELEQAFPPLDPSDRSALADQPTVFSALVAQLEAIDLDGGGPRNAKPRQVADCVVAALGLTLVDEPDRSIALADTVRAEVTAAVASVVDAELAVPRFRETVIAQAREHCEPQHLAAFDKIAPHLDDRAMRLVKQPKVPIEALHAVQRLLFATRNAVIDRVARTALDRAKQVIARANPDAAARIDQPITLRLTPRDVAITRAQDPHVPRVPAAVVGSLVESLTQLAALAWRAPERAVRPYAASQTFAVGDLIEHPKFGRGTVISGQAQRIEVEFADGKHTLVHVKPK
jgi:hypothetical protein